MTFKNANDAAMGVSKYERKERDFYPTPESLARMGIENALDRIPMKTSYVWEPCAGDGAFSTVLMEYYERVLATDIHDYGCEHVEAGVNFLDCTALPEGVTAIITNPPYGDDAEVFLRHALKLTKPVKGQVMFLLRKEYDSGILRRDIFWKPPFCRKIDVCQRPRWIEGSEGSPRHNYSHYLFDWTWATDAEPVRAATIRYCHPRHGASVDEYTIRED